MIKLKLELSDIVMGIFGLYDIEKTDSWSMLDVYEAFYKLKKTQKSNKTLNEVYFKLFDKARYSRTLEDIFFGLGASSLLEVKNPAYKNYLVSIEAKKQITEYFDSTFSKKEVLEVKKLSEKFRALIATR